MRNNKGFALVAALVVMTLLLALGGAAMTMSSLGYLSLSSDRKYQLANWAADYAINAAIDYTVRNAKCPPTPLHGTVGTEGSQAKWTYFAVPASESQYCFIHAKGYFESGTAVVKTLVVPRTAKFGGLITRGGSINLQGNATAIAGCDTDDTASCGIMPGVITEQDLTGNFGTKPATTCASNPVGGLVGSPPIIKEPNLGDLFARYFDVTDLNGDGNFWDGLQSALASKYSINLTPLPGAPTITSAGIPDECQYNGASACNTMSNNKIKCGTAPDIDLTKCPNVYINTTHASGLTISHNIGNISSVLSVSPVTINTTASNLSVLSSATLTIADNVSTSNLIGGTVTVSSGTTSGSNITGATVNINSIVNNSQILSSGVVTIRKNMSNTNVFANNITFNLGNNTIAGGIFYANTNITLSGNGNKTYGTDADPIMMLAGNQILAEGAGNSTIRGLIATNGTGLNITGSYEIKGTIINNSPSANLTNTGNADIKFNMSILKEVFNQFGSPMKEPTCGGGNIFSTVKNTKMTAY